jgi:hypothetical protein
VWRRRRRLGEPRCGARWLPKAAGGQSAPQSGQPVNNGWGGRASIPGTDPPSGAGGGVRRRRAPEQDQVLAEPGARGRPLDRPRRLALRRGEAQDRFGVMARDRQAPAAGLRFPDEPGGGRPAGAAARFVPARARGIADEPYRERLLAPGGVPERAPALPARPTRARSSRTACGPWRATGHASARGAPGQAGDCGLQ